MGAAPENDEGLIAQAHEHMDNERHLEAARTLRKVEDKSLLEEKHQRLLAFAEEMEQMMKTELDDSIPAVDAGWKKHSEAHSKHDAEIYYKVDAANNLTFRMEVVIEESLLIPLLAVMNESDLYETWMPSWKHPRLGISRSEKLHEMGRGNQIIVVTIAMPPPFATRECVQHAIAIDDIDASSAILIRAKNVEGDQCLLGSEINVAEAEKGVVRIDFECDMMIRFCPDDHPILSKSKKEYPHGEKKLLLTIKNFVNAKVKYAPLSVINFFSKQVIKKLLGNFLQVGEDVKSGKLSRHTDAIKENAELYQWVEARVSAMCAKA